MLAGCSPSPDIPSLDDGVGGGDGQQVDCSALTDEVLRTYSTGMQVLTQLTSQAQVNAVRDGTVEFSPVEFDRALNALRVLEGRPAQPYGDPADALTTIHAANDAATRLIDGPTRLSNEAFTQFADASGGQQGLGNAHADISASFEQYCG